MGSNVNIAGFIPEENVTQKMLHLSCIYVHIKLWKLISNSMVKNNIMSTNNGLTHKNEKSVKPVYDAYDYLQIK